MENIEIDIDDIDLSDIGEIDLYELPEDYVETPEQIEADRQWAEEKANCERLFVNAEITRQNKEKKLAKQIERAKKFNNFIL